MIAASGTGIPNKNASPFGEAFYNGRQISAGFFLK